MRKLSLILLFGFVLGCCPGCYIVPPGHAGVKVTLGHVSTEAVSSGFGLRLPPPLTWIWNFSVRQDTSEVNADCFSSDLQQVKAKVQILYRVPQESVVKIYRDYDGDPFEKLIAPRVQEAFKEATAKLTAEQIVKLREQVKADALEMSRKKVGEILIINDLVIEDLSLSKELEQAIEAKMVQEQEAAKAKFIQQQASVDATTAIIKAKGQAESIRIQGEALQKTPQLISLKIVEKWNGISPLVVGSAGSGSNVLLPLGAVK